MRKILLIGVNILYLGACNIIKTSPLQILNNSEKEIRKLQKISYTATLNRIRLENDTVILQSKVLLLKDSTFKPLGFKLSLEYPGKGEIRFNGDTIYSLDSRNKKLLITDVAKMGTGPITGNLNKSVIGEVFTGTDPYGLKTGGSNRTLKLNGTIKINNQKCWIIEKLEQDEEQQLAEKYFISRKSYLPLKTQTHFRYQDQTSYTEWKITDVNTRPDISANEFSKPFVSADFAIEYVKPLVEQTPMLLPDQISAPAFKLPDISQDTIELRKLEGKVVILDFWYMSCTPCLKMLPHLQRIFEKYQAQGLVILGVNSKDNNENDIKRLPRFLEFRKLTYPVLLGSKEIDKAYAITSYPSLYLIDKNGKIAYSQIGFSEEELEKLEKEIEKLITNKL